MTVFDLLEAISVWAARLALVVLTGVAVTALAAIITNEIKDLTWKQ